MAVSAPPATMVIANPSPRSRQTATTAAMLPVAVSTSAGAPSSTNPAASTGR